MVVVWQTVEIRVARKVKALKLTYVFDGFAACACRPKDFSALLFRIVPKTKLRIF